MDELNQAERELMCDPENAALQANLIRLYREKLGCDHQRAAFLCLTVWHPHAEARHVTRATRAMGPGSAHQHDLMNLVRQYVGARHGEEVMVMVTTGSLVPTRIEHRPEYRAEAPDVTVVVGCDWLIQEQERMIAKEQPPQPGRRRRRRW